ncbi:hypothetical protein Ancab_026554, partial [Ancistrocladus abbreviatus]
HDCKEAITEERSKRDTNDGTLIVWQQIGDGDMFDKKGVIEEMENSISLMKREKESKKQGKHASEHYPAEFSGDQNLSWTKEGRNIQPTMEQA